MSSFLAFQASPSAPGADDAEDAVLVGAGDIAVCADLSGAEATAKVIDGVAGIVFTLGDLAYPDGRPEDFANCYDPTWGRHKARTRPSIGNHDYHTSGPLGISHTGVTGPATATRATTATKPARGTSLS